MAPTLALGLDELDHRPKHPRQPLIRAFWRGAHCGDDTNKGCAMTNDRATTPDEQTEPVMDGAMDHEGPPPTTDSSGDTVDLSLPDDEGQAAEEEKQ